MIELDLERHALPDNQKILVVPTDPWRYDPSVGAKETLIDEVLTALSGEVKTSEGSADKAKNLLLKLKNRVNWSKAIQIAAKASLAFQLPSVDDLMSLVKPADAQGESESRGLAEFHAEFAELMESEELDHVTRIVVLVDDLDRCLYPTVVDTLETIRLFLAVPKMAFVIAADERRVADALRDRFPAGATGEEGPGNQPEHPADLYLHKIVQTTVPLPALSRFDTEAYIVLLQLKARLSEDQLRPYVDRCAALRRISGVLDDLPDVDAGLDISTELTIASRLTPILYEKLRGNPRRIKRFLNDLRVRQSIASRRGISLSADIVAKLMVLEVLLPDAFSTVLKWLAEGVLRDQMRTLESAAGRKQEELGVEHPGTDTAVSDTDVPQQPETEADPAPPAYTDDLIRWAKLTPALSGSDLAPYLHLAASFSGTPLIDAGLPARLRDIAANLLSSIRAQQKAVTTDDLAGLTSADAIRLVQHLARAVRDRPTEQQAAMLGIIRITKQHPDTGDQASHLLRAVPTADLEPGAVLLFRQDDLGAFGETLQHWFDTAVDGPTKSALSSVLGK